MPDCPDELKLAMFLDGALPESEAAAVRRHAADCPDCADVLADGISEVALAESDGIKKLSDEESDEVSGTVRATIARAQDGGKSAADEGTACPSTVPAPEAKLPPLERRVRDTECPERVGQYTIEKHIGSGGFGRVYLAWDTELHRRVAIKFLKGKVASISLELFKREAQAAAHLKHPHIVTIHVWGEHQGIPYLVMEYIEGTVQRLLAANPNGVSLELALRIAFQTADALGFAHQQGIVHRDVKPGNIMLEEPGRIAKLTDFGLASFSSKAPYHSLLGDAPAGSPLYSSPEQLQSGVVDARSDVFALGVTLYQLITGSLPFPGNTPAEKHQSALEGKRFPTSKHRPGVPEQVNELLNKALSAKPEERFSNGKEMAEALSSFVPHLAADPSWRTELDARAPSDLRNTNADLVGYGLSGAAGIVVGHALANGQQDDRNQPMDDSDIDEAVSGFNLHGEDRGGIAMSYIHEGEKSWGLPPLDANSPLVQQGADNTCAVRCQEIILRDFGLFPDEDTLVAEATANGWFDEGTPLENVGNLLEHHGVPVQKSMDANLFTLAHELAQNHRVIVGVDSGELWGMPFEGFEDLFVEQPDHAIVVAGIDTSDPNNITVTVTDPGTGDVAKVYTAEEFVDAWEDSGFFMVATREPAPFQVDNRVINPGAEHFDYVAGHVERFGEMPYDDLETIAQEAESIPGDFSAWDELHDQFLGSVKGLIPGYALLEKVKGVVKSLQEESLDEPVPSEGDGDDKESGPDPTPRDPEDDRAGDGESPGETGGDEEDPHFSPTGFSDADTTDSEGGTNGTGEDTDSPFGPLEDPENGGENPEELYAPPPAPQNGGPETPVDEEGGGDVDYGEDEDDED